MRTRAAGHRPSTTSDRRLPHRRPGRIVGRGLVGRDRTSERAGVVLEASIASRGSSAQNTRVLPRGGGGQGGGPPVDDGIGLAVAIELVPEQVRGDDDRRSEIGQDLGQGHFVDLEHAVARPKLTARQAATKVRCPHQRRGDPLPHVRPGSVGDRRPILATKHLRDEPGRGRLAVRSDDEDRRAAAGRPASQGPRARSVRRPCRAGPFPGGERGRRTRP